MTNKIIEEFSKAKIELNSEQAEKLIMLYEYMIEYNKNVNLTSITEFNDVVMKHFIDSIIPFTMTDIPDKSSFIDIGSGAGYPALPLMIYRSDLNGTLCDSLEKRCVYLKKACGCLDINAEIIHARAEELARKQREKYDFVCARAVASLPVLCELCLPFVKVGGKFIALKSISENPSIAQNAFKTLGGELEAFNDYKLPNGDDRRLIIIKKISPTLTKYPRSYANISKKPL